MVDVVLEGTFNWIKCDPQYPAVFTLADGTEKKSWNAIIYPTPESLEKIREMQADGIKNKLKKDEKGWFCQFSCPTEKINSKTKKVSQVFTAPTVVDADGKVVTDRIANGAKGFMKLDFYEHGVMGGGKSHAARLKGLKLTEWQRYGDAPKVDTEVKQDNYF